MTPHPDEHSSARRELLKLAATAGGLAMVRIATAAEKELPDALVDTNVTLFRWPLRRLPCDETPALVAKLRSHGVTQAWAGSLDALLHRDMATVNARLAEECRLRGEGLLLPFGSVNPGLPDWKEDLRRCAEEHRMRGIRLYPSYHGVKVDEPCFAELLALAAKRGLLVQVVSVMEDRRMMHPLLQVEPPDLRPLPEIVKRTSGLRLQLLNTKGLERELLPLSNVSMDMAMVEGVGGVAKLLEQTLPDRVLFGSHSPQFYFESALLKLRESTLNDPQLSAIRFANAQRLLAGAVS